LHCHSYVQLPCYPYHASLSFYSCLLMLIMKNQANSPIGGGSL
jgi:hypothetical protein